MTPTGFEYPYEYFLAALRAPMRAERFVVIEKKKYKV